MDKYEFAETVTVRQKEKNFDIIIEYDKTEGVYRLTLPKNAYEQLRQYFIMPRFYLNSEVIIYPNESGFAKIKAIFTNRYGFSDWEADYVINKRKTEDGGYRGQFWVIAVYLHDLFGEDKNYMKTSCITLLHGA